MPAALVQAATEGNSGPGIGGNLTLASPAAAGRLLTMVLGIRNGAATSYSVAGWSRVGYTHSNPGVLDSDAIVVFARIALGGEQVVTITGAPDPASGTIAEWSGFSPSLVGLEAAGADMAGAVATLPALAPSAPGAPGVLIRGDWKKAANPNPGPMTLAGWALLGDTGYAGFGNRHRLSTWYLTTDGLAANYAALARSSSGDGADTGVVLTAAAIGLAARGFRGEPGGGVW